MCTLEGELPMGKGKNIEVSYCPRCEEDHGMVRAKRFRGNFISADGHDFGYWGWCPSHLDPIIFSVDDDEEIDDSRTSEEEIEEGKGCFVCRCSPECKDTQSRLNETE